MKMMMGRRRSSALLGNAPPSGSVFLDRSLSHPSPLESSAALHSPVSSDETFSLAPSQQLLDELDGLALEHSRRPHLDVSILAAELASSETQLGAARASHAEHQRRLLGAIDAAREEREGARAELQAALARLAAAAEKARRGTSPPPARRRCDELSSERDAAMGAAAAVRDESSALRAQVEGLQAQLAHQQRAHDFSLRLMSNELRAAEAAAIPAAHERPRAPEGMAPPLSPSEGGAADTAEAWRRGVQRCSVRCADPPWRAQGGRGERWSCGQLPPAPPTVRSTSRGSIASESDRGQAPRILLSPTKTCVGGENTSAPAVWPSPPHLIPPPASDPPPRAPLLEACGASPQPSVTERVRAFSDDSRSGEEAPTLDCRHERLDGDGAARRSCVCECVRAFSRGEAAGPPSPLALPAAAAAARASHDAASSADASPPSSPRCRHASPSPVRSHAPRHAAASPPRSPLHRLAVRAPPPRPALKRHNSDGDLCSRREEEVSSSSLKLQRAAAAARRGGGAAAASARLRTTVEAISFSLHEALAQLQAEASGAAEDGVAPASARDAAPLESWDESSRLRAEMRCVLRALRETEVELRVGRNLASDVAPVRHATVNAGLRGAAGARAASRRDMSYDELEVKAIQATLAVAELRLERDTLAQRLASTGHAVTEVR
ncbi:hypothetical protein AB1Y20_003270 [Prymnesium parvum]|uniref:Uncharacterized protein n=1 Tax=Prymnesium parvum TaxID=97485 RepID=A0AB34JE22_PRYPA